MLLLLSSLQSFTSNINNIIIIIIVLIIIIVIMITIVIVTIFIIVFLYYKPLQWFSPPRLNVRCRTLAERSQWAIFRWSFHVGP